ncbi:winged helix-turn-helix transcriptional regulator [Pseudooceanicola sp. 216_PA32_1]|jgi:Lrp/AsnC family transcriptional regulator, leucine-responsive regulatory protein|uniref:Winged helix-turn-helix transcriptional regulator n=1 Tax=Pseudooceanicola pacificus TaxID=2676438 RepID=A0A844W6B4_9RHOB|nr:Lrp/AsnC family transcriptional regulator [Pseudooceanicola pacificus]MWB79417.1 winged helix-turn-helix transcriptional regulator [Pseudooceanicola pacificus]
MDDIDKRIIAELQRDGRLSNVELAERVGLSPSPCLRRVRLLEDSGVIAGYRAVVGHKAAGLNLTVFVELTVARHSAENAAAVHRALAAIPGVVACHMVSGNADFLAQIVVPDLAAYERVLTDHILSLDMIETVRSNFALRMVCEGQPVHLP